MKKKRNRVPTQMNYLRIVVGGYLVYLAYDIFRLRDTQASDYWLMMLFVLLFTIFGGVIVIFSLKHLIKKEYYDPNNMDIEDEPEEQTPKIEEDSMEEEQTGGESESEKNNL
ncbi:MAG TPA: hypothetical protein PLU43_07475 [Lachnospiraceae bacterium]|nr:hypothetical protein [Lachnospiraceae bacterium]